jgi:hypothetical protein
MSYGYNRNAFQAGCSGGLPLLLRTYCALVSLELNLKDFLGLVESSDNGGHDLPWLLGQVKARQPALSASINSIQTQLRHRLSEIRCQGRAGVAQSIPAQSYPHLRYMRHRNDWPIDSSTDAHLNAVHTTLQKLGSVLSLVSKLSICERPRLCIFSNVSSGSRLKLMKSPG